MVQLYVKIPGESENCGEWVMIELQGDLETKSQAASLSGKFIGDLYFTKKGVPVLIVGHHILYGKRVDMEKPLLAMTKVHIDDSNHGNTAAMETDHAETITEYHVQAVIEKKLVFKTRPKPIIANVPKKI